MAQLDLLRLRHSIAQLTSDSGLASPNDGAG